MSKPGDRVTLEDLLDTYIVTVEQPDFDSAREWGWRFPEHAVALRDFVTSWNLAVALPPDPRAAPIDAATFTALGTEAVASVLLAEQDKDRAAIVHPIESLLAEAKMRGMTAVHLATGIKASVPLIAKLNRRLIDPESIPQELTEAFAVTLGRTKEAISAYLGQQPMLSSGAFHRAKGKPEIVGRESFFEAVRCDAALSEENRAYWLSMKPSGRPIP